ncbi:cytochrome P450 [Mycobacterium paraterrae]|uniref:Cytochrome P450 n=1 Tax=Mycobacterium paraterrae TaxID=577492 RepID=A0ABY3VNN1_9MYCO|nr:cytochrome P450 [Mycobacterium paraterrae]UMB71040.1 cytochrome P450 [Mycobacterium paraterrae]
MTATIDALDAKALPLAPKNPLPILRALSAARALHTGLPLLSEAGGPVTRFEPLPKFVSPALVLVTSPSGVRDVLGRTDGLTERCQIHQEIRNVAGDNLFVLPNREWAPRRRALQPVFTKQSVESFGRHMTEAAQASAGEWCASRDIDLDAECRRLAMRSLGRSILGIDVNDFGDEIAANMHVASRYATDRALRPMRAPRWLPTPSRRRARKAVATMKRATMEILRACRADPARDAPLVHALIAAADPDSGRPLSDKDICSELLIFMLSGHDTTATMLTYALWQLGHHPEMQDRVAAEVAAIGDRELTPGDVPRLTYTAQVINESLRLCPPAAGVGRVALEDIAVDGYRIEAGTIVAVGINALHRDSALWEHPLVFDPDRFSPKNSAGRDRWQFIPFAAGPRSCIGEHFAMLVTTLALATIIRSVRIRSMDNDFPLSSPCTTVAAGPIPARVDARR